MQLNLEKYYTVGFIQINPKGSGKLDPGKEFFLKLARDVIRNVNKQIDKNGHSYARKATVRTGLSLNFNGKWEEAQLSRDLQEIVAKHRNVFEGVSIDEADVETESDAPTHPQGQLEL